MTKMPPAEAEVLQSVAAPKPNPRNNPIMFKIFQNVQYNVVQHKKYVKEMIKLYKKVRTSPTKSKKWYQQIKIFVFFCIFLCVLFTMTIIALTCPYLFCLLNWWLKHDLLVIIVIDSVLLLFRMWWMKLSCLLYTSQSND